MLKPFTVTGSLNVEDVIFSSLIDFFFKPIGFMSIVFSALVWLVGMMFFEGYFHIWSILILLSLCPWFYKLIKLIICNFASQRRLIKKIEFAPEYIKFFCFREYSKVSITIPRDVIKKVKYTNIYIYIITEYKFCMVMRSYILSEDEIKMIKEYFKQTNSLAKSE
jgi:hypothetical protein